MSDDRLREDAIRNLVLANRVLAREEVIDGFGHVSLRSPTDPGRFLLSRSRSPEVVTRDDIQEFDLDGRLVSDDPRRPYAERFIHAAVYAARADVNAVSHHHAKAVLPFTVSGVKLRPVFHMASVMGAEVPLWDSQPEFGDTNMLIDSMGVGPLARRRSRPAPGCAAARARRRLRRPGHPGHLHGLDLHEGERRALAEEPAARRARLAVAWRDRQDLGDAALRHAAGSRLGLLDGPGGLYGALMGGEDDLLPFESSVGYQLRLTNRLVSRYLQQKIAPHGLTLGMWYFLRALWRRDGQTQSELSAVVGTMEPTTLTAVKSMERKGLVRREPDPDDRRKINVFLTERGRALKADLLPLAREVVEDAVAGFSPRDREALLGYLRAIRRNIAARTGEQPAAEGD